MPPRSGKASDDRTARISDIPLCPPTPRKVRDWLLATWGRSSALRGLFADERHVGRHDQDIALGVFFEDGPGREQGGEGVSATAALGLLRGEQEDGRFRAGAFDQGLPALPHGAFGQDQDGVGPDPANGLERVGAERPAEDRPEDRVLFSPQEENDGFSFHASLVMSLNFLSSQSASKSGSFWARMEKFLSFWTAFLSRSSEASPWPIRLWASASR